VASAHAEKWVSDGTLDLPFNAYSFLAATATGDLVAATFNTSAQDIGSATELPVLLIGSPGSPKPTVEVLCRYKFDAQRGYGGVACTSTSIFVSGDTGDPSTSFVAKFDLSGKPDVDFGKDGMVRPGKRCLGIDAFAGHVLVAVDWGQVLLLDATTGESNGSMPPSDSTVYVRDIALDPKSLRVFGVAAGGIVTWGGGTPWTPLDYKYRVVVPGSTRARAGEGISFDPLRGTLLITPIPGNVLREIHGTGAADLWSIATAPPDAHLCDSAMSADGTAVYISDMVGQRIHRMRREMMLPPFAPAYARPSRTLPPTVPAAQWHRSYAEVVEGTRAQGRAMAIYFRRAGDAVCEDFEASVLKTDDFNRRAANFVCVFEDVDQSPLLAHRFGVYSSPYICILDRTGEVVGEFRDNVDTAQLFAAMESAR